MGILRTKSFEDLSNGEIIELKHSLDTEESANINMLRKDSKLKEYYIKNQNVNENRTGLILG